MQRRSLLQMGAGTLSALALTPLVTNAGSKTSPFIPGTAESKFTPYAPEEAEKATAKMPDPPAIQAQLRGPEARRVVLDAQREYPQLVLSPPGTDVRLLCFGVRVFSMCWAVGRFNSRTGLPQLALAELDLLLMDSCWTEAARPIVLEGPEPEARRLVLGANGQYLSELAVTSLSWIVPHFLHCRALGYIEIRSPDDSSAWSVFNPFSQKLTPLEGWRPFSSDAQIMRHLQLGVHATDPELAQRSSSMIGAWQMFQNQAWRDATLQLLAGAADYTPHACYEIVYELGSKGLKINRGQHPAGTMALDARL